MSAPATAAPRRGLVLLAVSSALFIVLIDNTVVNVAIPSIQRALHASLTTLEWTVNAYTVAIAVLLVTGGRLGDIFGRRRVFLIGIALFGVASAAVAAAPSGAAIVAARSLQGVAAALLMPGTLSIISDAFPPEERGRAIGIWSGVSGIALVVGPLLGGAIIQAVSWRAIFLINVPIAIAAIALTLYAVRESRDPTTDPSLDLPGILTLSVALAAVTLALIEGNSWGWGSARIVALFATAAAALGLFIAAERRARAPIFDLTWLRSRSFSGANCASATIAFAMFGTLFFVTIYVQRGLGYSPLKAGAAFLPVTVVAAIVAPLAGRLSERIGTRLVAIAGLAVAAASMWLISGVTDSSGYGTLVPPFVLLGLAIGLVIPATSTAIMDAVGDARAGVGAGVVSMGRMVGGSFGVAALGAVFAAVGRNRVQDAVSPLGVKLPPHLDLVKGLGGSIAKLPIPPQFRALALAREPVVAHDALVHALSSAMRVGAGVTLVGVVAASLLLLGERRADTVAEGQVDFVGGAAH